VPNVGALGFDRGIANGEHAPRRVLSRNMNALSEWPRNRLLVALSSRDLKRLMPHLEHVPCRREQILMDADGPLDHIFFPDSGVVSVMAVYSDGSTIEMATIGREGCTGMQAVFGAKESSVRYWVQIPGSATKMPRAAFTRAVRLMPPFRSPMYAYVQAFTEQILVSGACNGAHGLKERLARWLLMMRDRSDDDALPITQNLIGEMLGVQRPRSKNKSRTRCYRFATQLSITGCHRTGRQ
jgi:CRP-like cAMP-binding protein